MFAYIGSILFALAGFGVAFYIHRKKRTKQNLVCPMKAHCDSVVYSQFSTFFGISVEVLGMLYYAFVALGYLAVLILPTMAETALIDLLVVATVGAFLFSVYLVFIQMFSIRQYCSWCLTSAALSTLIAVMTFWHAGDNISLFLSRNAEYVTLGMWLGLALGLGAATLTHIFYLRFLQDRRIDRFEASVLQLGSQVSWLALGVVIVTMAGTLIGSSLAVMEPPLTRLQVLVVLVLVASSAVLDLLVMPRLLKITANEEHDHKDGELTRSVGIARVLGPTAMVSWYVLFLLPFLPFAGYRSFGWLLGMYVGLVLLGVIVSRILEKKRV